MKRGKRSYTRKQKTTLCETLNRDKESAKEEETIGVSQSQQFFPSPTTKKSNPKGRKLTAGRKKRKLPVDQSVVDQLVVDDQPKDFSKRKKKHKLLLDLKDGFSCVDCGHIVDEDTGIQANDLWKCKESCVKKKDNGDDANPQRMNSKKKKKKCDVCGTCFQPTVQNLKFIASMDSSIEDWFCSTTCYASKHPPQEQVDEDPILNEVSLQLQQMNPSKSQVSKPFKYVPFSPDIPNKNKPGQPQQVEPLKLLPSEPLLQPPPEIASRYTLNEEERTIRADISSVLSNEKSISSLELDFLARSMERGDQTVIIKGATTALTNYLWYWPYILERCGGLMYHKFKCFESKSMKKDFYTMEETMWKSMTLRDYDKYLQARKRSYRSWIQLGKENLQCQEIIQVNDCDGHSHRIRTLEECIYLIDFPLPTYLPELYQDLHSNFPLPFLPAKKHCLLQYVPEVGRPFMGPNLYITPPGSFTWFHEDGHGTVDSGHQTFTGRNEVIMLRRLDEGNKQLAIKILSNSSQDLRTKPHDSGAKPCWPQQSTLDELEDLNFAPSHFTLEPGEYVHINKGRIHAFRKSSPLDHSVQEEICVSVAWDWIYEGVSLSGFQSEAMYALESAENNHKYLVASLGISQTAVLNAVKSSLAVRYAKNLVKEMYDLKSPSFYNLWVMNSEQDKTSNCKKEDDLLRGVKDSLQKIVDIEGREVKSTIMTIVGKDQASLPFQVDTWVSPIYQTIDPYSVDGFVCRICNVELANIYKHCVGCEVILGRDFNICVDCHSSKYFGDNESKFTSLGHRPLRDLETRNKSVKSASNSASRRCPCKQKRCERCYACHACACACHNEFTTHYRFEPPGSLAMLQSKLEAIC